MTLQAVITGDLVNSSVMNNQERTYIITQLKLCFAKMQKQKRFSFQKAFEVYRGDSFQCILNKPDQALRIAIILRTLIIKLNQQPLKINSKVAPKATGKEEYKAADARIAIGIGSVTLKARKVIESDGEAFHNSGKLLDAIKISGERIMVKCTDEKLNQSLQTSFTLLDFIMSKWTPQQCEAIYELLINDFGQSQLAKKLKISQPSVHQRLKISGWYPVEKLLKNFEEVFKEQAISS